MGSSDDRYLSTGDAGSNLGLSSSAIRKRCDEGRIPGAIKTGDDRSNHWRVPVSYVKERKAISLAREQAKREARDAARAVVRRRPAR